MNPFLLDTSSRRVAWKLLREEILEQSSPDAQIDLALTFWKQAPIENPLIDWDNAEKWPTPWELLHTNRFCEGALTLGVAYTLILSSPEHFQDLGLLLITDRQNHVQKIVAKTHSQVLNYGWLDRLPATTIKNCQVHSRWWFDGRNWQNQFSPEKKL